MKTNKNYLFSILAILILFLGLSINLPVSESSEPTSYKNQVLSENLYVDSKGFFKIRPPAGWQIREYMDDPRGKVDFESSITVPKAQLKVLGKASLFDDFQALLRDAELEAERLRSRFKGWGLDASINIEKISFDGAPAVKMTTAVPGKLKQLLIQFLRGKNHYAFAYGAPPDLFDKFFSVVTMSIESFEPILREVSKEDAIRHVVASKLRTANLYIQTGQKEWALQVINEGLQIAPENEELLELKKQIEKK